VNDHAQASTGEPAGYLRVGGPVELVGCLARRHTFVDPRIRHLGDRHLQRRRESRGEAIVGAGSTHVVADRAISETLLGRKFVAVEVQAAAAEHLSVPTEHLGIGFPPVLQPRRSRVIMLDSDDDPSNSEDVPGAEPVLPDPSN
jgi:hypothetical protein